MRNAYALLGVMFVIVFVGVYVSSREAEAPAFLVSEDNQNNLNKTMSLSLSSTAFEPDGFIPSKYSCDGVNINPPLSISGVPSGTKSFVLVMDDPDIPNEIKEQRGIEKFNHWAVYNLPPDTTEIPEGVGLGMKGVNGRGETSYTGPCPPTEFEPTTHRYIFRLYALSGSLNFDTVPTLDEIETAAQAQMIEKTELIGRYSRVDKEN